MYFCTLCKSMDRSNVSVACKKNLVCIMAKRILHVPNMRQRLQNSLNTQYLIKRRGNFLVIDSANNGEQNCHLRFFFFGQKLEKPFLLCEYQQMPFGHSKLLHNHSIGAKKKRFAVMSMISQQQRHSIAASRKSVGYKKLAAVLLQMIFCSRYISACKFFPRNIFCSESNLFIRAYFYVCVSCTKHKNFMA